jgi:hypothetical protein
MSDEMPVSLFGYVSKRSIMMSQILRVCKEYKQFQEHYSGLWSQRLLIFCLNLQGKKSKPSEQPTKIKCLLFPGCWFGASFLLCALLDFDRDEEGSRFLFYICILLPDYTA